MLKPSGLNNISAAPAKSAPSEPPVPISINCPNTISPSWTDGNITL